MIFCAICPAVAIMLVTFVYVFCFRFYSACVIVGRLVEKGVFSATEFESDESLSDSDEAVGCALFDDNSFRCMYSVCLRQRNQFAI